MCFHRERREENIVKATEFGFLSSHGHTCECTQYTEIAKYNMEKQKEKKI